MNNRDLKHYLSREFIARHEIAADRILKIGAASGVAAKICFASHSLEFLSININGFRSFDVAELTSLHGPPVRSFRSSGSSNQERSVSSFSESGLDRYKKSITFGFNRVLGHLGLENAAGLSLIPPVAQWPESSLAQMLAWIASGETVRYLDFDEPGAWEDKASKTLLDSMRRKGKAPLWLFGTSFHLLPLLDQERLPPLPRGSAIFYTGGTKGKTREITDNALISRLTTASGLDQSRIISEYGMCELASAAYTAFDKPGWFAFQAGAIPFIVRNAQPHLGTTNGWPTLLDGSFEGTGILGVFDFNRIDIPMPILTEDVVELDRDGSFRLLGRASTAPLKGCSMLVSPARRPAKTTALKIAVKTGADNADASNSINLAPFRVIDSFCRTELARTLLSEALGSRVAATQALEDLVFASGKILADGDFAAQAMVNSGIRSCGEHFFMIAPNSHPIAIIYPLAFILGSGRSVTLRLNRNQTGNSFLKRLVETLKIHGVKIEAIGPDFRFHRDLLVASGPESRDVFVFGSNQTIIDLQNILGPETSLHSHGDAITVSLCPERDLAKYFPLIIRDTFSLMQQGCMSSRLLLMTPESPDIPMNQRCEEITQKFLTAWSQSWGEYLDAKRQAGIIIKTTMLPQIDKPSGAFSLKQAGVPLLQISKDFSPIEFGPQLKIALLPTTENLSEFLPMLVKKWPSIKLITAPEGTLESLQNHREMGCDLRRLGDANRPDWNGYHFGHPLFSNGS